MARWMHGLGVSPGEAVGPVARLALAPALPDQPAGGVADPQAEAERATAALEAVAVWLERRAQALDGAGRDVLGAQAMIARDPVLADGVAARVRAGLDAPHAVAEAFAEHRRALEAIGGYLGERAADLDDLRDRAVAWLLDLPMPGVPDPGFPFVLVAGDLAPADTAGLDSERVLAIVTERGGPTGHTSILAKQLGIPAVCACPEASTLSDGQRVLVDGAHGEVVVEPSDELVAQALARRSQRRARRAADAEGPARTADGVAISLLANVGGPGAVAAAVAAGAEGIGLLRTEFLFLGRATPPSAAEQRAAYCEVFSAFPARKVVVRTLDVGADKPLAYLPQSREPNPALGIRGLRLSRTMPELLSEQLEAIAAAAAQCKAEVWVMAPMVATAEEARAFAKAARAAGITQAGVMVEVPSAALRAREVLAEVQFASIGTNDLAQYALAADRLAGELADLLDPWQPALLSLTAMTAQAGEALGRPVGVCGEAASDPLLASVLVGLGVKSLSMAPTCLADVRGELAARTLADCRAMAEAALGAPSALLARAAADAAAGGGAGATGGGAGAIGGGAGAIGGGAGAIGGGSASDPDAASDWVAAGGPSQRSMPSAARTAARSGTGLPLA